MRLLKAAGPGSRYSHPGYSWNRALSGSKHPSATVARAISPNDNPEMLRLQARICGVRGALYKSKLCNKHVGVVWRCINLRTLRSSSRAGYGRPCREEYSPGLESSGQLSGEAPSLRSQRTRVPSVWRGVRPLQSSSARLRPTRRRAARASRGWMRISADNEAGGSL